MAAGTAWVYAFVAMSRPLAHGAFVFAWAALACATSTPEGDDDGDAGAGADAPASAIDGRPAADADPNDAPPRRGFGEACTDKAECDSNICIFAGDSGVCSQLCAEGTCPGGWGCYGVLGAVSDGVVDDVCVPDTTQLCSPCGSAADCGIAATPNLCIADEVGAQFCARDCTCLLYTSPSPRDS